jgi:hypothetical protein
MHRAVLVLGSMLNEPSICAVPDDDSTPLFSKFHKCSATLILFSVLIYTCHRNSNYFLRRPKPFDKKVAVILLICIPFTPNKRRTLHKSENKINKVPQRDDALSGLAIEKSHQHTSLQDQTAETTNF